MLPFREGFRRSVEDPSEPLCFDMGSDSRTLLVAFGGMAGQLGMPPFEFFKATGGIPVKRLFVRDLHQAWYHRGHPGARRDARGGRGVAEELIAEPRVERLVVAGNSAGGYAALASARCSGPRPRCASRPRPSSSSTRSPRWTTTAGTSSCGARAEAGALDRALDRSAQRAAAGAPLATRAIEVYFDETLEVDRLHAERLDGLEGVRLQAARGRCPQRRAGDA